MKARKNLVMAGAASSDVSEIATFLRASVSWLDHSWTLNGDDSTIDFVIADLEDFGGRCARVRALDEGKHLAVIANAGDDVLGVELVLHRPLTPKAVIGVLNHVGHAAPPQPRQLIDFTANSEIRTRAADDASKKVDDDPSSTRARFLDIKRERVCTNLDGLIKRGAVLIERHGIPPLLIDPVADTFHSTARLIDLEPYFLDVVVGRERKRIGGTQLAAFRKAVPGRPLLRLRWLHALLRSNGWLAPHLDPSADYRLLNWFPLDADYRKQHRIAMTMLRGAPLHRIAATAKAKMADVFDVVNAYDALGLLECKRQPIEDVPSTATGKRRRATKKSRRLLTALAAPR
ncbi:MAG: hypothetical protein ABIR62_13665 [Dokdonella sp.]|uniref:hypothetical protein n=1 Tax=Dokdonella sp. TaxID=2291710 RepID=UPI003267D20F